MVVIFDRAKSEQGGAAQARLLCTRCNKPSITVCYHGRSCCRYYSPHTGKLDECHAPEDAPDPADNYDESGQLQ